MQHLLCRAICWILLPVLLFFLDAISLFAYAYKILVPAQFIAHLGTPVGRQTAHPEIIPTDERQTEYDWDDDGVKQYRIAVLGKAIMDLWKRLRRERHRREGAQAVAGEALPMESVGAPGAMDTGHGEGLSPQRLSGPSSSNRLSMPSRRDTICEARMEATANSNTTAGDISYANSQTPLTRLRSTSAASSTPSSLGRHLPEQHPRRSSDLLEAGPRMPPLAPSSSSGTPSSGLTTPLATPTEQDSLVVVAFESGDASKEAGSPSRQLFPPRKHPSLNPVRAAPAKRRRLLFSNPVTTISSTVATAAGTARTSKNAKKHHDDRKDVKDEEAAVESIVIHAGMLPVKSDISNASALPSPTAAPTEHVLSYGNGKGNEGVLRRVYDLWALTSLGLANIGPLQGKHLSFTVHTLC